MTTADDWRIDVKLKPCPFCGGEAHVNKTTYSETSDVAKLNKCNVFYGVNCSECGADTRGIVGSRTQEEAAKKWDRRQKSEVTKMSIARHAVGHEEQKHCDNCHWKSEYFLDGFCINPKQNEIDRRRGGQDCKVWEEGEEYD